MGPRTFAALVALFLALALAPAKAAPAIPAQPPATLEAMFTEVHDVCGRARAFCKGRFYGGPAYRDCVRARGCPVSVHPAVAYCTKMNRDCRHRWGGGPHYRRCMLIRGC